MADRTSDGSNREESNSKKKLVRFQCQSDPTNKSRSGKKPESQMHLEDIIDEICDNLLNDLVLQWYDPLSQDSNRFIEASK